MPPSLPDDAATDPDEPDRSGIRALVARLGPAWTSAQQRGTALAHSRRAVAGLGLVAVVLAGGVTALVTVSGAPAARVTTASPAAESTPSYLEPVGTLIATGALPAPTLAGDTGTVGVPKRTPALPTRPNTASVAGTSRQIAGFSGGDGTLTPAGIATLALQQGCPAAQAVTATAISMAESGGSPGAQGDIALMTDVWDWSAGLWQIRGLRSERGTGGLRDSVANQSPVTNAHAMYVVSGGCAQWTAWSTYNTGAYLGYLAVAQQAVDSVEAYYRAHGNTFPVVAPPDPNAPVPVPAGGFDQAAGIPAVATRGSTPATTPKPGAGPAASAGAAPPATRTATGAPGGSAAPPPTAAATPTAAAPSSTPVPHPSSSSPGILPGPVGSLLPTKPLAPVTSVVSSVLAPVTSILHLPTRLPIP